MLDELKHGQEEHMGNQTATNKELNEPTQFLLRKNLKKTIDLLYKMLYEKTEESKLSTLINPLITQKSLYNSEALDKEFHDAINSLDSSKEVSND
ncbi:hypothetical protein M9Y10_045436 [Tritrichomonas musculus]|uniref:Uncharacterized protein n=1 Tax=Tritrichomonas musculus TaxID=1915356 RepID=A0ABR2JV88_9EUKA